MRGELYQNLIATLLIVLALASVSLVVNLSGLWWLWAPLLASLATLAAVFLREVEVPVGGRSPAEVSQALAAVLGTSAMARAPREDLVTARLNALAAIRFRTRMAREAYEAQRKAYTDSLLTTAIAAFTAWTALLVGLFIALNGFNLVTGRWEVPIAGATVTTLVFGILFLVSLRRRYVPRLARYREWTERLADSMGVQLARAPPESGQANTFELLVSASEQVPDWLDAQRRAGLSGDPKMAFLILLLTLFTGSFLMNGLAQLLFGGIASAGMAYLAIGAFLVGLTAWIYLRWKREEEARLNRSRAAWDAHLKALHARMDRFLEEM